MEEGPELLSTTIPRCTAVMAMCSQEPAPTGIEETFRQHELLTELSQFIDQNLRVRVDVGGPIKGQAALARREVHIVQEQIAALIASEEAEMARIKANQAESEAEKQEALNQQRRQEIKEAALDAAVKVVKGTVKVVAVTAIVAFKVAAFLATPLGKALKEAVQEAKRQAREKR